MKTGLSLQEMASELQRQQATKKDITAPSRKIEMALVGDTPHLVIDDGRFDYGINKVAHQQIATHVGIPATYYKRMQSEAPDLLARNVNEWMHKAEDRRMVRSLDGTARAFLSDKFPTDLENLDLAEAAIPVLFELGVKVVSCDLTETRMWIKAVDERIAEDVPTGRKIGDGSHVFFDTICPAIALSNSEVGFARLLAETSVLTRMCTNLASFGAVIRKTHIGARQGVGDEVYELLSDQTKRATAAATFAQIADVVRGSFNEARFKALAKKIGDSAQDKIEGKVDAVIDVTVKRFGLTQDEGSSILKHLIEGGDLTRYGLHAAITRSAEDTADYDRASELERLGGKVIELAKTDWREIAAAA